MAAWVFIRLICKLKATESANMGKQKKSFRTPS